MEYLSIHTINIKNVLVTDFVSKKKATTLFLFLITDTSTSNAMKQFQLHINNIIVDINNVYIYFNLFILFEMSILLTKVHSGFVQVIKAAIIANNNPNYYKRTNNSFYFCNS